jgi:hypothetical protein
VGELLCFLGKSELFTTKVPIAGFQPDALESNAGYSKFQTTVKEIIFAICNTNSSIGNIPLADITTKCFDCSALTEGRNKIQTKSTTKKSTKGKSLEHVIFQSELALRNQIDSMLTGQTIAIQDAVYLEPNWCKKQQRRNEGLTRQVCISLKEMFDSGAADKGLKISADRAHHMRR